MKDAYPLRRYYDLLKIDDPQKLFRKKVCKELNISINTFYRILDGERKLSDLEKNWLSHLTGLEFSEVKIQNEHKNEKQQQV